MRGLENDELWKIIRRFDKQVYHVKATADGRKRGLRPELEMDLVASEEQDYTPDRIRLNLERLYISFVSSDSHLHSPHAEVRDGLIRV